jgi:hypothetical protein
MWVPYGDVSLELGGLMILEGSHKKSDLLGNYLRRDVDSYCLNRLGVEEAKAKERSILGRLLNEEPCLNTSKTRRLLVNSRVPGRRRSYLRMTLVHASLDNQTDRIRFSSDSRYQLASEAIDDRWVGSQASWSHQRREARPDLLNPNRRYRF